MRRTPLCCLMFAGMSFALCSAAAQANAIINVGGATGNVFEPQTVTVNLGDSVTFINKGGFHNVVADDGSFRCARGCDGDGHGGNGGASGSNWIATVVMTTPGTIGYFCEIHGMPGSGMFGSITVQGAPPQPVADSVPALNNAALAALAASLAALGLGLRRFSRLRRR